MSFSLVMLSLLILSLCQDNLSCFIQYIVSDQHVLVHGDTHMGNMLYYLKEDGSPSNKLAAILDWQTMYEGNPMLDMSRFMVLCVDAGVRRDVETECVDIYYTTLEKLCKELGRTVPFTREEAHEYYDYAFMTQTTQNVNIAPITADKNNKIIEASDGVFQAKLENFVMRTRHAYEDAVNLMKKHKNSNRYKF